jgi:hypothetical protein
VVQLCVLSPSCLPFVRCFALALDPLAHVQVAPGDPFLPYPAQPPAQHPRDARGYCARYLGDPYIYKQLARQQSENMQRHLRHNWEPWVNRLVYSTHRDAWR